LQIFGSEVTLIRDQVLIHVGEYGNFKLEDELNS